MRVPRLVAAAFAVLAISAVGAQASPGFATADVNIRTGPDIDFPSVGIIPEGEPLSIEGCLRDESWCDVLWDGGRGWVYSEYLAFDDGGEMVPLPDVGPAYYRIPFITFVARDYWDRWYVGRPWYRDRDRWYGYTIRPRIGWHAPPPGQRRSGWWRQGYHAPAGMRPPPGRGWRRPEHYERRHDGRDDWRDDRRFERRDDRRFDRRDDRHDGRDSGRGDGRGDGRDAIRGDGRGDGWKAGRGDGRDAIRREGPGDGWKAGRGDGRDAIRREGPGDGWKAGRGDGHGDGREAGRGDGPGDGPKAGRGDSHGDGREAARGDGRKGDKRKDDHDDNKSDGRRDGR